MGLNKVACWLCLGWMVMIGAGCEGTDVVSGNVQGDKPIGPRAEAGDVPQLPSGPPGPGPFGAYYTRLTFTPEWDAPWRVGDYADVVVRFDNGGHRFVFWRGTSYIPCWVTDAGVWYTNEFVERRGAHSPKTEGCVEPMSDKQCRFSHVRVIESNNARVVVHWRYAPVDVQYEHPFTDPATDWSDWVDEYYTIYPDASGVRRITVHTSATDRWCEFQECIVVNQPGTMPDDNIDLGAVTLANMDGQEKTYTWTEEGGPEFEAGPPRANIIKINIKGSVKPYAIAPPAAEGQLITPYSGHGRNSHFNWWDHWPVSQTASDGRGAVSAEKPSHSSLAHIGLPDVATAEWKPYEQGPETITKIMLHGLTDKAAAGLAPLAKSWLEPVRAAVEGPYASEGYDPTQLAYILVAERHGQASELTVKLEASEASPVVNPAFVVEGWGSADASVSLDVGASAEVSEYRVGHSEGVDGKNLIVWIKTTQTDPMTVKIAPLHPVG